jgi:hypothetical protein
LHELLGEPKVVVGEEDGPGANVLAAREGYPPLHELAALGVGRVRLAGDEELDGAISPVEQLRETLRIL